MVSTRDTWKAWRRLTDRAKVIADEITVYVVANTRSEGALGEDERTTEQLSVNEANQILMGLAASGFRTRYFDGELSFLRAAFDEDLVKTSPRALVYCIAQSGRDAARKALVPAFCSLAGLPTCNSNGYAMVFARNKFHLHCVLRKLGLPTPDSWLYRADSNWADLCGPPRDMLLIAKALRESASIGLSADSAGRLADGFEAVLEEKTRLLGQPLIVQELIAGFEVEIPLVEISGEPNALGVVPISIRGDALLGSRFLDFETVAYDAYGFEGDEILGSSLVEELRETARHVFRAADLSGIARVDFRVTESGRLAVIDVATSPHVVWHSSFAHLVRKAGLPYEDLLAGIVAINADRLGWL